MSRGREEVRRRLEKELSAVRKRFSDLKKRPPPQELASGGDNTPLSEKEDRSLQVRREELSDARLERLVERAAGLEQALKRNEEGSYGLCISCGRRIDDERLEAIPETPYCVRCAESREPLEPRQTEPRIADWEQARVMRREASPAADGATASEGRKTKE